MCDYLCLSFSQSEQQLKAYWGFSHGGAILPVKMGGAQSRSLVQYQRTQVIYSGVAVEVGGFLFVCKSAVGLVLILLKNKINLIALVCERAK